MSDSDPKRRLLAELLSKRRGDSITDVAAAVSRFAPHSQQRRVFLASCAAARSGNPTECLLFAGDKSADRWVRGVLIVSHSIQPPGPSTFLDRRVNGRVLFGGGLLLRVVGVALPPFDKAAASARNPTAVLWALRESIQAAEEELKDAMECCVRWLMQKRYKESRTYFSTEPPILSVPVYYYAVHIEDNATARLADVLDVSIGFMDAMIDADLSITRTTTALLQALVQLSDETTGDVIDSTRLYALHCRIFSHCKEKNKKKKKKKKNSLVGGTEWYGSGKACWWNEEECVNIADIPLDDTPVCLDAPALSLCESSDDAHSIFSAKTSSDTKDGAQDLMDMNETLPGVLVHCMKGVSRSPSIVMAYYMHKFTVEFCADKSFSFLSLLQSLREVRPVVDPQVCFIAELKFMWSRLAQRVQESNNETTQTPALQTLCDLLDSPLKDVTFSAEELL